MVNHNGTQASAGYVLLTSQQDQWLDSLLKDLRASGYTFSVVTSEDAHAQVTQAVLALVVVGDSYDEQSVGAIQAMSPDALFILVQTHENGSQHHAESVFEVQIPYSSPNLAQQIKSYLKLHQQNQQLRGTVERLEQQIQEQHRSSDEIEILKNAIVRNVSHELRTPLLQVKSAVTLIAEDVSEKKLVSFAENAMARLEILVKNITMYGQSLDIRLGPIILRDAVEFARRSLGRIWERRSESDRIQLKLEENLPPVIADKQGLSTVLQLLMDNALKFSGKDQPIEVIGCLRGEYVYIAVRDYGIGIAEDKLHDIFESFYQIDNSSTRRYGGMGIGLALVKLILDHHKTEIHVESKLGKGSTFWFLLPRVDLERDYFED